MNIKELRERAGLTQGELAERIGVSQTAVAKWETGGFYPRGDKIEALAAALNCTPNDLYAVYLPPPPVRADNAS